jgi:transposase-like protein
MRKTYEQEFKCHIAKEALETKDVGALARKHTLNSATIYRWVKEYKKGKYGSLQGACLHSASHAADLTKVITIPYPDYVTIRENRAYIQTENMHFETEFIHHVSSEYDPSIPAYILVIETANRIYKLVGISKLVGVFDNSGIQRR